MPHGHGGGHSHGGSHRSGGGGSRRGGGGHSVNVSVPRISRRYFRGSRRFMYRGFGGAECFVYCEKEPKPISTGEFIFSLAFSLFFVGMGVLIAVLTISIVSPPKRLNAPCSGYHIEDNIGAIDNIEQLELTLKEFEEKTGICPCVVTVYDDEWQGFSRDIEDAAYYEYVSRWRDEKHFLILYSKPYLSYSTEWEWHDMSGDDTDRIITDAHFSRFQKDLNRLLSSKKSAGRALDEAFRLSLDYMMDGTFDFDTVVFIIMAVFWNAVSITVLIKFIVSFIVSRRKYTEVPEYYKSPVFQDYSKGYDPNNTYFE